MNRQNDTDNQPQSGRQAQQDKSDSKSQPGQQAQHDKPSRDFDTRTDRQEQEKQGKGKVATSSPAGSESDEQSL